MKLAIQIVNFKTKKYLFDCIEGIEKDLREVDIEYKILILDNASGDDLSNIKNRFSGIELHYSDQNKGFGAGHNYLSKKIESEFILILNPDIKFIEADTITRLISEFSGDLNIAVVGPKLVNECGDQRWDHGELKGFWAWYATHTGGSHWTRKSIRGEVAWVSGAFFLIRRDVFEKVRKFDEKFFLYKEEEDLCLRIRQNGYKVIYEPAIQVFHHGSAVASKSLYFDASDRYFVEKHFRSRGILSFFLIRLLQQLKYRLINHFLYR